jgi:hypothetical protein
MGDEEIRRVLAAQKAYFDAVFEQARAHSERAKKNPNFMLDDLAAELERKTAEIRECTAAASSQPAAAPRPKKQPPRTDYRDADAPLVEEMIRGIASGLYKSDTDAARAVASRAAGNATPSSKAARMARRLRERKETCDS